MQKGKLSAIIASMFGFGGAEKKENKEQTKPTTRKRQSEQRLRTSIKPNYYGFRKCAVLVEDKNGNEKLETLKMADKKGLKIIDTLGIADKIKLKAAQ